MPDSAHDTHDIELVAALAAGDAAGTDLATATDLVASCAECAALHADLRSIAAAVAAMPAPVRTRDFRITAEQAASLRPTGWRALVATLAAPRFSFAAPLGTGLAALGIVGLLVAGGVDATGGSTGAADQGATSVEVAPELVPLADASAAPVAPSIDPNLALKSTPGGVAGAAPADGARESALGTGDTATPLQVAGVLLIVVGLGLIATRILARRLARAP